MAAHAGRANRIGEQIHRELSEIFAGDLADPRFESVTVTGVELSRDLGSAKVRFLSSGDIPAETALETLARAGRGVLSLGLGRAAAAAPDPSVAIPLRSRIGKCRPRRNVAEAHCQAPQTCSRCWFGWVSDFGGRSRPPPSKSPSSSATKPRFPRWGRGFTVAAYGSNRGFVASVAESAFDELRRADRMLSNYQPESELSLINRHAAEGPWKISEPMADLLARCLDYSRLSEGGFDMTVGPLMEAWGFFSRLGPQAERSRNQPRPRPGRLSACRAGSSSADRPVPAPRR